MEENCSFLERIKSNPTCQRISNDSDIINEDAIRSKEDIKIMKYLERFAKHVKLSNPQFRIVRGCQVGENFSSSVVYRTMVEGEKNGKLEVIYSILKYAPEDQKFQDIIDLNKMFHREIYFYEEILPIFRDLLNEYGMTIEHFPRMEFFSKELGDEVLFLEDLNRKGFVLKSSKITDYPHASLMLQNIGRFHAYSFATRAKRPDVFERFKTMEEPLFYPYIKLKKLFGPWNILSDLVAKVLSGEDQYYIDRFNAFRNNFYENIKNATDGDAAEPYAVVVHGDCWTNNILYKYDDGSSEPKDLYFIDFQLSRYASPVLDIVYPLFSCGTPQLRHDHYDHLLHDYYDSLCECLEQLNCDPQELFPYEALLEQLKNFGSFGALMVLYTLHLFSQTENSECELMSKMGAHDLIEKLEHDETYRNTLRLTVKELIDRDYM